MKLISLNTYGGTFFPELANFIREHASSTDIFCFQEIFNGPKSENDTRRARANLFAELQAMLPDHNSWFAPAEDELMYLEDAAGTKGIPYGLAMFAHKKYAVEEYSNFFIYKKHNTFVPRDYSTLGHNAESVTLSVNGKTLTVVNAHGMSEPGSKLDTPERIKQSQIIINHAATAKGEVIITGDFNLLPDTKSVRIFEEAGYRNLVADFNITTTRGSLIKKLRPEYANTAHGFQEFADYTFISKGIKPLSYTVPDIPVSDHLPLLLEFSL